MPEQLKWTFAARLLGGPTVGGSGELIVDGYVKLAISIEKDETQEVEIFPGTGGSAQIVIISPSKPDPKLTYKLGGNDIPLDGAHVFIGSGAVGMLGNKVSSLEFTNKTDDAAEISILAGRDATP